MITEWTGFKFSSGFFIVYHQGKIRFGKCDPVTKEPLEWHELF